MAQGVTGADLTPWLIRYAYEQGAFPMSSDDGEVDWYQPVHRALFPIEGIHLSRTMRRVIRNVSFDEEPESGRLCVTFDRAFSDVMRGCLRPDENWISEDFIRVYTLIHFEGWGHSVEVWNHGELVGGLYGIAIGSCFCAESMFHRETNASKIALWAMVERCRELGFTIFDAQVMNPHLQSLGAYTVPNKTYLRMLGQALQQATPWSITR